MSMRRLASLVVAVALAAIFALGLAGPAGAVDNPSYTAPPPTTVVTSPTTQPKVETAVKRTEVRTRLAITGSESGPLAAAGIVLVGAGVAVLYARRRHLATS